jgi:chaperone required for assembly of F1-ATPase
MAEWKAKRFWKNATVEPSDVGFAVHLDGRSVRTPAKAPLDLPTRAMAEAVAAEWQAQRDEVDPGTMPVTRSANAAIDKVAPQFEEVAAMIAAYGDSDLVCYRAIHPEGLVARQAQAWDPLVDWSARHLGAPLRLVSGVMHAPQPATALEALGGRVGAMSPFELAALHDLVSLSGSLVIGLAVFERFALPEELWALSRIDESWQIEEWGEDEEAMAAAETKRQAFLAAARFYRLSRDE